MHRVFISYHHRLDQWAKDALIEYGREFGVFFDRSVQDGDIDPNLPTETIRRTIRDNYLRDTTVTILLVGQECRERKYVDMELFSSMYDGQINKKSGILIITLPDTQSSRYYSAVGDEEKRRLYPETTGWMTVSDRAEYNRRYPEMPDRIIDCLLSGGSKISIVPWETMFSNPDNLRWMIDRTFDRRAECVYDLSRPMRKADSPQR